MTTRSPRRGAGNRAGVAGRCTDCCRRPHVDQRGVDLFCGSIRPCRQRFGGFGTRLRTFSKAYGLAGLRIGYGFGAPELARSLWTTQLPFGIAITSAVAVAASYDADTQLRQRIQLITAERHSLRRRLRAMFIYSIDSHAVPALGGPTLARGVRPGPSSGPPLRGRRRADHDRHTRLHPCGEDCGRKRDGVARPPGHHALRE